MKPKILSELIQPKSNVYEKKDIIPKKVKQINTKPINSLIFLNDNLFLKLLKLRENIAIRLMIYQD